MVTLLEVLAQTNLKLKSGKTEGSQAYSCYIGSLARLECLAFLRS